MLSIGFGFIKLEWSRCQISFIAQFSLLDSDGLVRAASTIILLKWNSKLQSTILLDSRLECGWNLRVPNIPPLVPIGLELFVVCHVLAQGSLLWRMLAIPVLA